MNIEHVARDLASHLVLTRPLVCIDLEATGVMLGRDRIVQIATATILPNGLVTLWESLVNPEMPIPAETTAVHGITDAMVTSAPTFAQVAPTLSALLLGSDLAGYNVERFDRRLLGAEYRRVSLPDPTVEARCLDAYLIFARREPRSLDAALRFYGVEDQVAGRRAHEAASDVEAALAVLTAQVKGYTDLPKSVEAIYEWLVPVDPNRIDADGKLVWVNGVAAVGFGAQAGRTLQALAATDRGFLEWIVRKDFSDEVKAIVRDALAGKFHTRAEVQRT